MLVHSTATTGSFWTHILRLYLYQRLNSELRYKLFYPCVCNKISHSPAVLIQGCSCAWGKLSSTASCPCSDVWPWLPCLTQTCCAKKGQRTAAVLILMVSYTQTLNYCVAQFKNSWMRPVKAKCWRSCAEPAWVAEAEALSCLALGTRHICLQAV